MLDSPFKVVLLGDAGVGKTSIIIRFIDNSWDKIMDPTIGQTFLRTTVDVNNQQVALNLWDTPGQERYTSQCSFVIRDADCCIVVYDASATGDSYKVVEKTVERCKALTTRSSSFVLVVANKCDLLGPSDQAMVLQKLDEQQDDFCVKAFLASAKTGENIAEIFAYASELLVNRRMEGLPSVTTLNLETRPPTKRACC
jgi:small GTP-binding protein